MVRPVFSIGRASVGSVVFLVDVLLETDPSLTIAPGAAAEYGRAREETVWTSKIGLIRNNFSVDWVAARGPLKHVLRRVREGHAMY